MHKAKTYILLSLVCLFSQVVKSQTDTLFWFAAPEVSAHNQQFDRPILLRISTLNSGASVIIDMPANPSFSPIGFTIAANSTQTTDLTSFINSIENSPSTSIQNKGLRIRSSQPVSAYYEVRSLLCNCNPEIFALKGANALGTHFLTPFQLWFNNSSAYSPSAVSQFIIVASENNTQVTIYPSKAIVGFPLFQTLSITLQRGETFAVTAASRNALDHLAGSEVVANKPIAITISDDLLSVNSCADLAGDQLIPISKLGTEYIAIKGSLGQAERVFILATDDNTTVEINGNLDTVLSSKSTYIFELSSAIGSAYIKTNKPVYVLHLSGFGCEVGLAILPPIVCTGSKQVGFTRSTGEGFFLLLTVKTGGEANFFLNGNNSLITPTLFTNVAGSNGEWKYAVFNATNTAIVPLNNSSLLINTTHFFHVGILNGGQTTGCRYGFFSDFQKTSEVKASATDSFVCLGGSVRLVGQTNSPDSLHQWTGPNGFESFTLDSLLENLSFANSGKYYFEQINSTCGIQKDSFELVVADFFPKPQLSSNAPICRGASLTLLDTTSASFGPRRTLWFGPTGTQIGNGSFRTFPVYNGPDSLYYSARHTRLPNSRYCDGDTAQILIRLHPSLSAIQLLPNDTLFCEGGSLEIENTVPVPGRPTFQWSGPLGFNIDTHNKISVNALQTGQGGYYSLRCLDSNGCFDLKDSVFVRVVSPITAASIANSSPVCEGDSIHLFVQSSLPDSVNGFWMNRQGDTLQTQLQWTRETNIGSEQFDTLFFVSYSQKWPSVCPDDTASTVLQLIPLPPDANIILSHESVCEDDSLSLTVAFSPLDSLQHFWIKLSAPTDTLNTDALFFNPAKIEDSDVYIVFTQNSLGCYSLGKDTASFVVLPRPDLSKITATILQSDCEYGPVQWLANSLEPAVTLRWKGPQNFNSPADTLIPIANRSLNGNYYLTAQWGDCKATDSLLVSVALLENPFADFVYTPLQPNENDPIQFNFTGTNAGSFVWNFGDNSPLSNESNPTHSYLRSGNYTVSLTVGNPENLCFDTSSATLWIEQGYEAVYIPTAFSPNGDGLNDVFTVVSVGIFNPVQLRVYNRWGELLYVTEDAEQMGWDGTYKGGNCPSETYLYEIVYKNAAGKVLQNKGTFQLMR